MAKHAEDPAKLGRTLTPKGRGSDAGRSEEWGNKGAALRLRQTRADSGAGLQLGHANWCYRHRERLEALGEARRHIRANFLRAIWAVLLLSRLVARHLISGRGGHFRVGRRIGHSESHRRGNGRNQQRPEHRKDAESRGIAVERSFSHEGKLPCLVRNGKFTSFNVAYR